MPSVSAWLGQTTGDLAGLPTATAQQRAALAWRRINDKPTSVVFKNAAGATLATQTVRLEYDDGVSGAESVAGNVPVRKLVIFGVKDHATVADTVIGEGYRFNYLNDAYRVVDIIYTIGEVQGIAEATG